MLPHPDEFAWHGWRKEKAKGVGEVALANLLGGRSYKVVADKVTLVFSTLCVCIYIYMCVYIYMYIYRDTYIYIEIYIYI